MRKRELARRLRAARARVGNEISANSRHGDSMFASGLSTEGYAGGFQQCLDDILLLIEGVEPNDHRGYWRHD